MGATRPAWYISHLRWLRAEMGLHRPVDDTSRARADALVVWYSVESSCIDSCKGMLGGDGGPQTGHGFMVVTPQTRPCAHGSLQAEAVLDEVLAASPRRRWR